MTIDDDFEDWVFDPSNLTFTEWRFWKAGHGVICYLDAEPDWLRTGEAIHIETGIMHNSFITIGRETARQFQLVPPGP